MGLREAFRKPKCGSCVGVGVQVLLASPAMGRPRNLFGSASPAPLLNSDRTPLPPGLVLLSAAQCHSIEVASNGACAV
jgi:hypothetical protein